MTGDHFIVRNCKAGAPYFKSKLYLELANDGVEMRSDVETLTNQSKYNAVHVTLLLLMLSSN